MVLEASHVVLVPFVFEAILCSRFRRGACLDERSEVLARLLCWLAFEVCCLLIHWVGPSDGNRSRVRRLLGLAGSSGFVAADVRFLVLAVEVGVRTFRWSLVVEAGYEWLIEEQMSAGL